jgi:hypothetical protein
MVTIRDQRGAANPTSNAYAKNGDCLVADKSDH